jgi:phage shock protein PspC (stress-responsive transcriptional regulator)
MDDNTEHTAPKRLTRRSHDKVIAGVAGGLADYTGVDPVIFRIVFVVLAVAGGSGLLLYLLAWLVIPEEEETEPVGHRLIERLRDSRWLGMVAIVIGVLVLIDALDAHLGAWEWAVGLLVIGFLLLREDPRARPSRVTAQREVGGSTAGGGTAVAGSAVSDKTARVRRPRSALSLITVGAALLAVGAALLLTTADVLSLDPGQYIALTVAVLGIGLIVSGWWGRARILILVATALLPFMFIGSMIDLPLRGTVGDIYVQPRTQVADEYRLLAGSLNLDLTRYRFTDVPLEVDASFVVGGMEIYVPPGVEVTLNGELKVGETDIFGRHSSGTRLALDGSYLRPGLTDGQLIVNVDGGIGMVRVIWARWVDDEKRATLERQQRHEEGVTNDERSNDGANRNKN